MFKTKAVIIFTHFLFTILLSACGGVGSSDLGSTDLKDSLLFLSMWVVPSGDESITLPLVDGDYKYNFTVDWGDGQTSKVTSHDDPNRIHTYEEAGDYNLVIEGLLEAWSFNDAGDKDKILIVEDFGHLGYKNLSGAFHGCTNLTTFEGGVTSNVTDMSHMFNGATQANPNVSKWNVSKVTRMNSMFQNTTKAIPDVSGWDVSKVTNMSNMFDNAVKAAPDVSEWDVSKVTRMNSMFQNTTKATPDVSEWDVSKVINMSNMFAQTRKATPDVSKWNVSEVTDMTGMFTDALQADPDVSKWNVSKVTNMSSMFSFAIKANPNVSEWKVSKVTNMSSMFLTAINAEPDVRDWDVSSVLDMLSMFKDATKANPDVSLWNVSSIMDMSNMFDNSGLSAANYDAFLINLVNNNSSVSNVPLGALSIRYDSGAAATAKTTLRGRGWTITDGGDSSP